MAKFNNAKVGDKVWSPEYGWGTIFEITDGLTYDIHVNFEKWKKKASYTKSGYYSISYVSPSLFWNEVKLPTEEEDKRPFNLAEFLINNLEPKEFENGKPNYYLRFTKSFDNSWSFEVNCHTDMIGVCFKEGKRSIEIELTRNKITPKQLRDAYKELGWL